MSEIAVLLHNVRSAHNVGSIFRTADAAGVSCIFLCGYTPRPVDRFGREQKEIAKTALGAETSVPWEYIKDPKIAIKNLTREGWNIVAVEQNARASNYRSFVAKEKTLYIFGNEVRGISSAVLSSADSIIEIPMRRAMLRHAHHPRHTKRGKESLNVAVAAGIILYTVRST